VLASEHPKFSEVDMATATAIRTRTAVGYCRVSTAGQAGERNVSLEVQEAAFRDYCQVNHLTLLVIFTDVASGRKDARPQYLAMLEYVANNDVDTVVVLFLDRFGRNPREILRRYWALQESGVTVQSIREDLQEELMLLLRAGIAGQDSKRTSERVSMSLLKAATKGNLVNKLPYGLTKLYDTEGKPEVVQVPEEASVIREAFHLAVNDNKGYKAIADTLNARGHRTKLGALFATQSIKLILTNPAIAGHMVFRGAIETVEHKDVYPAILTAEEWGQLQERLRIRRESQRGKASASDYLLSGMLRCGRCGGAMAGASKGPGKPRLYVCANWKMSRDRCEGNSHHREPLEEAILEHLGQYSDPEVVRQLLEAQGQETDTRDEAELGRVTGRLAELEKGFLNDLDRVDRGIMTEPEYIKRQEVRRQEQDGLLSRKVELEASVAAQRDMKAQAAAVPVKVQSFLEDFQGMDVRQAKAILQGIIQTAHVFTDGRIELRFR